MFANSVKLFLRLALSASYLSAVADRFGWWGKPHSVWGDWNSFLAYTQTINPWLPPAVIPTVGVVATGAEALFAICLLLGFKTELTAKLSGGLLLLFALAMTLSTGIKSALDYSVLSAAGASFAIACLKSKFLEVDALIEGQ
jgi:thiosulfate dehydrogenase (quinone) large subunit